MAEDTQSKQPAQTPPQRPVGKSDIDPSLEVILNKQIAEIEYKGLEKTTEEWSKKVGLPYLNLRGYPINSKALLLVGELEAQEGRLAVIARKGKDLTVAVYNPTRPETQETLKKLEKDGFITSLVSASMNSLGQAWKRYALERPIDTKRTDTITLQEEAIQNAEQQIKDIQDLKTTIAKMPTTKILDVLIAGALKLNASDIHLEPGLKAIRLRYRLDGVLIDILDFPETNYTKLLSRIKLHAGMKINIHDRPQDGRFKIQEEKKNIEVRVSVLPGPDGESVVMRILDPETIRQTLETLGMRPDLLEIVKRILKKTTGAFFTTGPTGSGKTTTLYAFIKYINTPEKKIITLEDPIEYRIEGITQTQVDDSAGYSFNEGLRSIVRQDPDVILVGEIRDYETAEMAAQAALTGHLVFTTIHTNNAAGAIPRLVDLGLKSSTIAPAMNATMTQRLVRRLCKSCTQKKTITKEDLELLKKYLEPIQTELSLPQIGSKIELNYPGKCKACNGTGYKGRIGVYEMFEVDSEMERLIVESPISSSVETLAIEKGMITLLQDGLIKVLNGITSVEEILRVIGL
ncbi:MAG: GspE/PulE family protein [Parcubacteria group bacterium]